MNNLAFPRAVVFMLGLIVVPASADETVKMSLPDIRCVYLTLRAPSCQFSLEELTAFFDEVRDRLPDTSITYSSLPCLSINGRAGDFLIMQELVGKHARGLYDKWDVTIDVSWMPAGLPLEMQEEKMKILERPDLSDERSKRLRWTVTPRENSTVGDALQTLASVLMIRVRVMPPLLKPHDNDWKAVLDLPLAFDTDQTPGGLTMQSLIDHLAQRLGGVADFEGDVLMFDDPKDAERRREVFRKTRKLEAKPVPETERGRQEQDQQDSADPDQSQPSSLVDDDNSLSGCMNRGTPYVCHRMQPLLRNADARNEIGRVSPDLRCQRWMR